MSLLLGIMLRGAWGAALSTRVIALWDTPTVGLLDHTAVLV